MVLYGFVSGINEHHEGFYFRWRNYKRRMEEITTVALWIGGIFVAIISGLLGWIVIILRYDRSTIEVRLEKHEGWIIKQQEELGEWSKTTHTAIELIKQEQKQGQERLKIFQENFFDKKKGKRN